MYKNLSPLLRTCARHWTTSWASFSKVTIPALPRDSMWKRRDRAVVAPQGHVAGPASHTATPVSPNTPLLQGKKATTVTEVAAQKAAHIPHTNCQKTPFTLTPRRMDFSEGFPVS